MKKLFIALAVTLLVRLPSLGVDGGSTGYSEGLKVDANGMVRSLDVQLPVTFPNGLRVGATNLGITKEVYISTRTDNPPCVSNVCGSGTALDPYDGSTSVRLKAAFAAQSTYTTIHLVGAGPFLVDVSAAGGSGGTGILVKTGWTILGSGTGTTTVRMTGNMLGETYDHEAFKATGGSSASNVTIRELTVDCNGTALAATATVANSEASFTVYAILISGSNNLVEKVAVTGQYGTRANNHEAFGILLGGGTNSTIRHCSNTAPVGNYGSPFAMFNGSGSQVYGCYADSGVSTGTVTTPFNTGGVNIAGMSEVQVHDNIFVDCYGVIYHDTGDCMNVKVYNNRCTRGWAGVSFVSTGTVSGIEIYNNTLEVQKRLPGFCWGINVWNGTASDVSIRNNKLTYATGGTTSGQTDQLISIETPDVSVGDIQGNIIGAGLNYARAGVNGVRNGAADPALTVWNNRLQSNAVVSGLPDNHSFGGTSISAVTGLFQNVNGNGSGLSNVSVDAQNVNEPTKELHGGSYTVLPGDRVLNIGSRSASQTLSWPSASGSYDRKVYYIKDITGQATAHPIVFDPAIEDTDITLNQNYQGAKIRSYGGVLHVEYIYTPAP